MVRSLFYISLTKITEAIYIVEEEVRLTDEIIALCSLLRAQSEYDTFINPEYLEEIFRQVSDLRDSLSKKMMVFNDMRDEFTITNKQIEDILIEINRRIKETEEQN